MVCHNVSLPVQVDQRTTALIGLQYGIVLQDDGEAVTAIAQSPAQAILKELTSVHEFVQFPQHGTRLPNPPVAPHSKNSPMFIPMLNPVTSESFWRIFEARVRISASLSRISFSVMEKPSAVWRSGTINRWPSVTGLPSSNAATLPWVRRALFWLIQRQNRQSRQVRPDR